MQSNSGPDPIVNSDRLTGTTPPENAAESSALAGRPLTEKPATTFHEPNESLTDEQEPLSESEALSEGGSFDGVAPLQDISPPKS